MSFPSEPSQLSNDWLTSILCDSVASAPSPVVVGHEWAPVMQGAAADFRLIEASQRAFARKRRLSDSIQV
jgi:hypothetical protein